MMPGCSLVDCAETTAHPDKNIRMTARKFNIERAQLNKWNSDCQGQRMERRSLQEKSKRQEPLVAPTNRFKSYTASRDESFPPHDDHRTDGARGATRALLHRPQFGN